MLSLHTSGDREGLHRQDGAKVKKRHRNHLRAKRDFFMTYINKQTSEQLMWRSTSLHIFQSYLKKHATQTTCSPHLTVTKWGWELTVSHCGFQCAFQELPHGFPNHIIPGFTPNIPSRKLTMITSKDKEWHKKWKGYIFHWRKLYWVKTCGLMMSVSFMSCASLDKVSRITKKKY